MADHGNTAAAAMDYPEHERTYAGFVKLIKWAVILSVATLVGRAIFLL
jgi:hypothetical protein